MKIIDISGSIYTGMWHLPPPFPEFELKAITSPEWVKDYKVYTEEFKGISQTGTFLETPAHVLGYEKSYPLIDVGIDKLFNIATYVFRLDMEMLPTIDGVRAITKESLLKDLDENLLKKSKAILVSTGYGRNWRSSDYLTKSPFFKYDAMEFIVSKKPFLLGFDLSKMDNLVNPENHIGMFFNSNILMLGLCINLEEIKSNFVKLTALPLKIEKTCCTPCRALVVED